MGESLLGRKLSMLRAEGNFYTKVRVRFVLEFGEFIAGLR
jgi:ABC-type enterochelin transport system ATPase subunit